MITVCRNVAGSAVRDLLRMLMCHVVPNRYALAAQIPAALDLIRRGANSEYKVGRKLAMRFGRPVRIVMQSVIA